jgi:hypothetical protein
MSEGAMVSVHSGGDCVGFMLRAGWHGWRAFVCHAGCAARVRLGAETELGFFPSAGAARAAILQYNGTDA